MFLKLPGNKHKAPRGNKLRTFVISDLMPYKSRLIYILAYVQVEIYFARIKGKL